MNKGLELGYLSLCLFVSIHVRNTHQYLYVVLYQSNISTGSRKKPLDRKVMIGKKLN